MSWFACGLGEKDICGVMLAICPFGFLTTLVNLRASKMRDMLNPLTKRNRSTHLFLYLSPFMGVRGMIVKSLVRLNEVKVTQINPARHPHFGLENSAMTFSGQGIF